MNKMMLAPKLQASKTNDERRVGLGCACAVFQSLDSLKPDAEDLAADSLACVDMHARASESL